MRVMSRTMSLADARRLLGWSIRRLAAEAGEKPSNISDLEPVSGRAPRNANPSHQLVTKVIAALQRGGLVGLTAADVFPVEIGEAPESSTSTSSMEATL